MLDVKVTPKLKPSSRKGNSKVPAGKVGAAKSKRKGGDKQSNNASEAKVVIEDNGSAEASDDAEGEIEYVGVRWAYQVSDFSQCLILNY
jgi:hypothetical protein